MSDLRKQIAEILWEYRASCVLAALGGQDPPEPEDLADRILALFGEPVGMVSVEGDLIWVQVEPDTADGRYALRELLGG